MTTAFNTLPPDVQDALLRGRQEDAVELLRKARGISLKGAHSQIASVLSQGLPAVRSASIPTPVPRQAIGGEAHSSASDLEAAASRLAALLRGAVLRRGRHEPPSPTEVDPRLSSLAPGEQPRFDIGNVFTFALAVAALAVLLLMLR